MILRPHVGCRQKFAALFLLSALGFSLLSAQPKTLGLLKKISGNDENGYVLFAPMGSDSTYLINKCGKRVHTWYSPYTPGMSVYLKPNGNLLKAGTYTDTAFGMAGGRGGVIEEYDWNNNLIWRYILFNDSLCQHHDITPMPNGNILVLAWHSISKSKAISLGRDSLLFGSRDELWGERIIEIKPVGADSAEVVWQWDVFDHLVQDRDSTLPGYGLPQNHPERININYALDLHTYDWIHANSLDYNAELDQIVISAHNMCEVWIIDHSTTLQEAKTNRGGTFDKGGDLLYRWGNPEAYGMGTSNDRKLFRQHNARWIPEGYREAGSIMVFNNGWGRDTAYSTVDIIRTPLLPNNSYVSTLPYGPVNASWVYKDSVPTKFYSQIISGAQMMPNGNVLICSGVQGRFFEVNEKKKILWEYRNPVNGKITQSDGQNPWMNSTFRCGFYSADYPAFTNKQLKAGSTIEKKSYPYSCNYETEKPQVIKVYPENGSRDVAPGTELRIIHQEAVLKRFGNISIYADNKALETISVSSDLVRIVKDTVFIRHIQSFPLHARISVRVPNDLFRDSSYNYSIGLDSSKWVFHTVETKPEWVTKTPLHTATDVAPAGDIRLEFSQRVFKKNSGSIQLFENGKLKENIPVASSRVVIEGSKVKVTSSASFTPGVLVVVSVDSCFRDTWGQVTAPVVYGDWYFRIVSAPSVTGLSPLAGEQDVAADVFPEIRFNRPVIRDSADAVDVYADGKFFSRLLFSSGNLITESNTLRLLPGQAFPAGARIAIVLPGGLLKDTFGLKIPGMDSSAWSFSIARPSGLQRAFTQAALPFPNPTTDVCYLSEPESTVPALFDMKGRNMEAGVVYEPESRRFRMDVSMLPAGLYMVKAGLVVYLLRVE